MYVFLLHNNIPIIVFFYCVQGPDVLHLGFPLNIILLIVHNFQWTHMTMLSYIYVKSPSSCRFS